MPKNFLNSERSNHLQDDSLQIARKSNKIDKNKRFKNFKYGLNLCTLVIAFY